MSTPAISSVDPTAIGQEVNLRLAKTAQDIQKQAGQNVVDLIEAAAPQPSSPDGRGANLNTYA